MCSSLTSQTWDEMTGPDKILSQQVTIIGFLLIDGILLYAWKIYSVAILI